MSTHRRLAGAAGLYLLAAVFGRLQFFVTLPLVSRHVTPAEYGVLTLANVVAVFVASTVQATVSGAVERFYADHEGTRRAEVLGTIFVYLLALAVGILVLSFALGPSVAGALLDGEAYPFFPYFAVPVLTATVASLNTFATSLFRIEERPGRVLAYALLRFAVAVVAVFVAVGLLGHGLVGYLAALFVSELIVLAASVPYVLSRITPRLRTADLRNVLVFTLPLAPYVLLALARDTGDRWILQDFVSIERIGVYGLGWGIASAMNMVVSSLTVPYAAVMMKRFPGRPDAATVRANLRYFRPFATQTMVLTLVAYALFLLVVEDGVRALTPAIFHEAWKPAALLGGVFVLRALYLLPHNTLQWTRRTGAIPLVTGAGLALGLPAIALLAPVIGTAAGPAGIAISYATSWLACAAFLPSARWLYPGAVRITLGAAAVCAAAGTAVLFPPESVAVWGIARALAIGGLSVASVLWIVRQRERGAAVIVRGAA